MDTQPLFDAGRLYAGSDHELGRLELADGVFRAQLRQRDPSTGLRGWSLWVALPGRVNDWPERSWSKQAAGRPPTYAERIKALSELGFKQCQINGSEVPADWGPYESWQWQESSVTVEGPSHLFATTYVRKLRRP